MHMANITLGRTGIITDKNGFGALPIQRVSFDEAAALLRRAYEVGITFFDTAHAYSDSEEKIGYALADVRAHIILATKVKGHTPEDFWRELDQSLRMMKTDYVDIYQFHMAAQCYRPGDGTGMYEAMLEAKAQGKIRHIGITAHKIGVAEEAVDSGLYDTLQFPLSYLSGEKDLALALRCKEKNVGFIAMKGLAGGLITNSAAAYAWLDQWDHVLPIWGVQKPHELEEFISYMASPPTLDEEIKAVIAADVAELGGGFCRACGYCLPCPVEIPINMCARMSQLIRRSPSADFLSPAWQANMAKIDDCIHCGQCISRCPYELNTPALLKQHLADYRSILSGETKI